MVDNLAGKVDNLAGKAYECLLTRVVYIQLGP